MQGATVSAKSFLKEPPPLLDDLNQVDAGADLGHLMRKSARQSGSAPQEVCPGVGTMKFFARVGGSGGFWRCNLCVIPKPANFLSLPRPSSLPAGTELRVKRAATHAPVPETPFRARRNRNRPISGAGSLNPAQVYRGGRR